MPAACLTLADDLGGFVRHTLYAWGARRKVWGETEEEATWGTGTATVPGEMDKSCSQPWRCYGFPLQLTEGMLFNLHSLEAADLLAESPHLWLIRNESKWHAGGNSVG